MMNQRQKDQTSLFARIMSDKETLNYLRRISRDLVYSYADEIMNFECAYKGNGKQMRKSL